MQRSELITAIYIVLFLAKTLYAVVLDRYTERWQPNWVFAMVAIGVGMCLVVPFTLLRLGLITTAAEYELATLAALVIGGIPVGVWQVARVITRKDEVIEYQAGNDEAETLAGQCQGGGGRIAGSGGRGTEADQGSSQTDTPQS
jgi:hypothetical protein